MYCIFNILQTLLVCNNQGFVSHVDGDVKTENASQKSQLGARHPNNGGGLSKSVGFTCGAWIIFLKREFKLKQTKKDKYRC